MQGRCAQGAGMEGKIIEHGGLRQNAGSRRRSSSSSSTAYVSGSSCRGSRTHVHKGGSSSSIRRALWVRGVVEGCHRACSSSSKTNSLGAAVVHLTSALRTAGAWYTQASCTSLNEMLIQPCAVWVKISGQCIPWSQLSACTLLEECSTLALQLLLLWVALQL
jgi:hypothetical protein